MSSIIIFAINKFLSLRTARVLVLKYREFNKTETNRCKFKENEFVSLSQ